MPRVPVYQGGVRQSAGQQMTVSPTATADNFGQSLTAAAGNALEDYKQRTDQAALMKADNALSEWETSYMYDPQNGALSRQGENAFGLQQDAEQEFQKQMGQAMSYLQNDDQRRAFQKLAAQRRQQVNRTISSHVRQQVDAFEKQQATSLIENSRNMAALNFNSDERIGVELNRQRGAILGRARALGWDNETTKLAITEAEAATYEAVISRKLSADPDEALRYYASHKGGFSPQQQAGLDKAIRQQTTAARGQAIAMNIAQGGAGGSDSVWDAMVHRESRGQQFNADGEPLTSSKGAVGVAQVMPDTAPEAARMAGLEWSEDRYRNDPDYNMALGRAYFNNLSDQYGDATLAAAAYNAGPGRMNEWLKKYGDPRKGEISKSDFIASIPYKETREYVQGLEPDQSQGAGTRSRADALASLRQLSPETRDAAETELKRIFALEDMRKQESFDQAQNAIEGGQSFNDLPASVTSMLDNKQINTLRERSKKIATREPTQNWQVWTNISQMSREELAQIDDPYSEFRNQLDDTHYGQIVKRWNEARGRGDGTNETSNTLTFLQRVKNTALQSALVPADKTPAKYSEEESLRYARFESEAANRIEQAELQAGKKLTGNEQQQVLDEMVMEKVSVDRGWLGGSDETFTWALDEDDEGDVFVPIADIPENDRTAIANLMRSNGVSPSDDRIQKIYGAYRINDLERANALLKGSR